MKESFKNFIKGTAIVAGLGFGFGVKAQATQNPENNTDTTKITKDIPQEKVGMNRDTVYSFGGEPGLEFDLDKLYEQNKVANDASFDENMSLNQKINDSRAKIKFDGVNSLVLKYMSPDQNEVQERYGSLEELYSKHPELKQEVENEFLSRYLMHKAREVLRQTKDNLANNFENYVPNSEEMELIKSLVERKNNGENLDGHDDISKYINNKEKLGIGYEEENFQAYYRFYKKYNGTPFALTEYLTNKYFRPFIKN